MLVGSIAHNLRTSLFSLRGYLDAIEMAIGDPGERLEQAQTKAHQIDRLIAGLFDYARTQFYASPQLMTIELGSAVSLMTSAFEFAAHERGVKLHVTSHTQRSVKIDRDRFERALSNVIDNALRHSPPGGTVEVTCDENINSVYVNVIDDGPGISPELLPRIFDPTVLRAKSSYNGYADGAGLGLTIAAHLLRNQGRNIDAGNSPPRGAILTIRLSR